MEVIDSWIGDSCCTTWGMGQMPTHQRCNMLEEVIIYETKLFVCNPLAMPRTYKCHYL